MSNDVCGYITPSLNREKEMLLLKYISSISIGICKIKYNELYNFPEEYIPSSDCFAFLIGDRPGYPNATYLIDYDEYDPESSGIGFPPGAKERLKILLDTLADIIRITNSKRMVVAMTECNQIETVRKVNFSDFYDEVYKDFEKYQAPPDTLYDITVK